ncbi:MAG: hypothetical protein IPI03_03295 [Rubrivivax sp.]|nr:hypothetical protein [Rubrivivax sp.]
MQANGEEIVWQDPPTKRFGAGILFPIGSTEEVLVNATEGEALVPVNSPELAPPGLQSDDELAARERAPSYGAPADDPEEEDVTLANSFRPSAIGISFMADLSTETTGLVVELVNVGRVGSARTVEHACGTYAPLTLQLGGAVGKQPTSRKVWLRMPVVDNEGKMPAVTVSTADLLKANRPIRCLIGPVALGLELVIVSRFWHAAPSKAHRLLTISVANKKKAKETELDSQCLYQAGIRVSGASSNRWIDAYPENLIADFQDPDPLADENVNRVLYRRTGRLPLATVAALTG